MKTFLTKFYVEYEHENVILCVQKCVKVVS